MNHVMFKHLRQVAGYTQQELAERIGCTRSLLSKIENGSASVINVQERFHKALNEAGISGDEIALLHTIFRNKNRTA